MKENHGLAQPALAIRFEQARRWRNHDRVPAEEYLAQHPELNADPEYALEVVYGELLLREEEGDTPHVEEFVERFPQFASQVRRLFDVHMAVRSACLADSQADTRQDPLASGGAKATFPLTLAGYEIYQELGRGGMGLVFKARQLALDRFVALKVIRDASLAGPNQVARFRSEALAVARLHHPHIVQIYDVGEHNGSPFLALEFIDGSSLALALKGMPLQGRQAAELVETLANAMHYAHKQGILHRDLKPANVLLQKTPNAISQKSAGDPQGTLALPADLHLLSSRFSPKITDFGLAKRLDEEAGLTGSGQMVGTPSYMAPEQAGGKADSVGPAVDIYALGAILYECLTGRPPFLGATALETLEQVRDWEPAPPHLLQPKAPRDLETVCLKCLEKDPTKRYPAAEALAQDLRRFLDGVPIQARPIRAWERGLKWARRRPSLAGLLAAGILGPVVLLAVVLSFNVQLAQANDEMKKALVAKEEKQRQSNESFRLARLAIDDYATKVSQDKRLQAHDLEGLRKELLRLAVNYYQEFVKQHPDDVDVRRDRAQAFQRLGRLAREMGAQKEEAIEALRKAVDIFRELQQEHPDDAEDQVRLAGGLSNLSAVCAETGQSEPAKVTLGEAIDILRQLVMNHPNEPDYQDRLAGCLNNQGMLYEQVDRSQLAETAYLEAQGLWTKLTQAYPSVEDYQSNLAKSHFNLGMIFLLTSRLKPAEGSFAKSYELRRKLAKDHPTAPDYQDDLGDSLIHMGLVYEQTGRYEQAVKVYGEAGNIYQLLAGDHPRIPEYRNSLARVHHNLGVAQERVRRSDLAEAAYVKACEQRERLVRDYPKISDYQFKLSESQCNLGLLYRDTGRLKQAGIPLDKAREIQEKLTRDYPDAVRFRVSLGNTYNGLGRLESLQNNHLAALDWFDQSTWKLEAVLKQEPRHTQARRFLNIVYLRRVETLSQLNRYQDALHDLDKLLKLAGGAKSDPWRLLHAVTLARMGQYVPAMAEGEELASRQSVTADTLYNLACVSSLCSAAVRHDARLDKSEQDQRAEQLAARSVDLLKKAKAAGFFEKVTQIEEMWKDKDLESVRERRDFQELFSMPPPTKKRRPE
jgi:serine/threonine-protein kinase